MAFPRRINMRIWIRLLLRMRKPCLI